MLKNIAILIITIDIIYYLNKYITNKKNILSIPAYTENSSKPEDNVDVFGIGGLLIDIFYFFKFKGDPDPLGYLLIIGILLVIPYASYTNDKLIFKIKTEGIAGTIHGKYKKYSWEVIKKVTVDIVEEEMIVFLKNGDSFKLYLDYVPDEKIKEIGRVINENLNKEIVIY